MMDRERSVNKNKRRREKNNRTELQSEDRNEHEQLQGLYFDGRKDETLMINKLHLKVFHRTEKERYSLIQELGSVYIGHVSPLQYLLVILLNSIFLICLHWNSPYELDVIGCDGTVN